MSRKKRPKTTHGKTHTQCRMISYDSAGAEDATKVVPLDGGRAFFERVAWIPSKFGKKGKWIKVDGVSGNWQVVEVWNTRPTSEVQERSHDHTKQRKASDV